MKERRPKSGAALPRLPLPLLLLAGTVTAAAGKKQSFPQCSLSCVSFVSVCGLSRTLERRSVPHAHVVT